MAAYIFCGSIEIAVLEYNKPVCSPHFFLNWYETNMPAVKEGSCFSLWAICIFPSGCVLLLSGTSVSRLYCAHSGTAMAVRDRRDLYNFACFFFSRPASATTRFIESGSVGVA